MGDERVYQEKADFVANELAAMVRRATRGVVSALHYERQGAMEYVVVETPTVLFDVNVTADSLWAVAKDVMRAVGERFE